MSAFFFRKPCLGSGNKSTFVLKKMLNVRQPNPSFAVKEEFDVVNDVALAEQLLDLGIWVLPRRIHIALFL